MRCLLAYILVVLPCAALAAEPVVTPPNFAQATTAEGFQLGGAAVSVQRALSPEPEFTEPATRLSLPRHLMTTDRNETRVGPATFFVGENFDAPDETFTFGTVVSRGVASAGVTVTYQEDDAEIAQSEVFLDFAVSDQFTIGVSSILNSELDANAPVQQLGISAEYATEGGAFLQGGFSDAETYEPVFGVSVGFRF